MAPWKVPLFDARFGPDEEEAVLRPLRSGWLTMGDEVRLLEDEIAAATGAKHAIAVANCTAALHLACLALEVGPGDEVICPTLTFVATANAPRLLGAAIRFCESVGEHDLTMDPAHVESLVTERTRAIMVVHYAGFACDMGALQAIAERHGLAIVEDCAHALFTTHSGRTLGRWGRVGCFSFFSNKNATCGEGGALITDDDRLADRLRLLRSHGMTTLTLDRHRGRATTYDVLTTGVNYRLDEIHAALLRVQLRRLPDFLRRRREIFHRYVEQFRGTPITLPFTHGRFREEIASTGVHILACLLPEGVNRDLVMARMKELGIQTSIHYPPIHRFTAYESGERLPRTEALARRELTLPFHPLMSEADVDFVVDSLLASVRAAGAA